MLEMQLADGHSIGMSLECLHHKSLQFDWCNNIPSHVHVLERLGRKEGSMETKQSSMDMVFIIFTRQSGLLAAHEQSANSLGARQFGTLVAQWAWPCTAKC